jgi:hypothetical protein
MAKTRKPARNPSKSARAHFAQRRALVTAAGGDVSAFVAALGPHLRPIARSLRALVRSAAPSLAESIKWGNPCFVLPGGKLRGRMICTFYPVRDEYLNFAFVRGASLDDPSGLLEGTGQSMRHVKLRSRADLRPAQFTRWLKQALAFAG